MTNLLEQWISDNGWHVARTMDLLQCNGIVSDLCVGPETVAEIDCQKAVNFLEPLT